MDSIQLSFYFRTITGAKTIHVVGSWDSYTVQLPLSRNKVSSESGSWIGTFRFQGGTLKPNKRYWFYYIVDGHQVTHNPSFKSVMEPITRRILNFLDIPCEGRSQRTSSSILESRRNFKEEPARQNLRHNLLHNKNPLAVLKRKNSRDFPCLTLDIPKGRPVPISMIKSPRPITPHPTKLILETDYSNTSLTELKSLFDSSSLGRGTGNFSNSPSSSIASSSTSPMSRLDTNSPSSVSSLSYSDLSSINSCCSCECVGITRQGDKIKLDCGGTRCGYTDDSSSCDSSEEDNHPRRTRMYW